MNVRFYLRKARQEDAAAIRRLIYRTGINPMALNWQRFLIAIDEQGHLLGCGQVKPHSDGTRELASIAVQPEHQRRGIGQAIIQALIDQSSGPLYLTCRKPLRSFYEPFGFRVVSPEQMPPYFRHIWRAATLLRRLFPSMDELLVMVRNTDL